MSLIPGSRIGPYDVLAPIGAGGMGEVFRALDSRETYYAAAPDGRRLLMLRLVPEERAATNIHIVFAVLSELRQRVR